MMSDPLVELSAEWRLRRIEAILRVNGLHEPTCASLQPVWLREPANAIPRRPCDCWLTKGKP